MSTRVLEQLTLDAIKATSIAHHLQRGERSHFDPTVSDTQRLAELGDLIGKIFEAAALAPDSAKLQQALLWLSATSAIWAELIDTDAMLNFGGVANRIAPWQEQFKEGGIIK